MTGIGGSGKTRLALRLAESLLQSHPDGVWFVDLSPLREASRVAEAIAATLAVGEEPGKGLLETLVHHVSGKRLLLVLDNCEHLLDACGALVDALLRTADDVRVLVTSRESLGIEGERLFALRSLAVPSGTRFNLDAVKSSEAVRLFVDRAQIVDGAFVLDAQSAPPVVEICRRLDGIPLAIELAAARVKMLSVEEIRSRLDDRFRLLTGGHKALPRHQRGPYRAPARGTTDSARRPRRLRTRPRSASLAACVGQRTGPPHDHRCPQRVAEHIARDQSERRPTRVDHQPDRDRGQGRRDIARSSLETLVGVNH